MVRITRRDFLKYCSVAAGALGLSASTLMKIENVMAANGATDVVWISGSACTGCTMSLLNSRFYTTVDDLLLNRINLAYLDTVMATAGAYVDGVQHTGSNALAAAQNIYDNSLGYVLVVEGAIPTGKPENGAVGDFCRIGDLTGEGHETVLENVQKFAEKDECLAVLCVGTCSSFGGIPGARGNVTGAKGVCYTGTTQGGAIVTNSGSGEVTRITVDSGGSGYTSVPTVTIAAPPVGSGGTTAQADARTTGFIDTGDIVVVNAGSGYTATPTVTILGMCTELATATATLSGDTVGSITVTNGGEGYSTVSGEVTIFINSVNGQGTGATADVTVTGDKVASLILTNEGSGYTSAPAVSFSAPAGSGAAAHTIIQGQNDVKNKTGIAAKVINIPGCPPHPDWIVGTIAHILDTGVTLPPVTSYFRPVDYGYGEYQCNAGPCPWRFNNSTARDDHNARYPVGESRDLGKYKWGQIGDKGKGTEGDYAQGCLGILGCKGRKTKADCSRRRWNGDNAEAYGVNWCVGSRGGCHGCTEPAFPDKVGKFFTFV